MALGRNIIAFQRTGEDKGLRLAAGKFCEVEDSTMTRMKGSIHPEFAHPKDYKL